MYYENISCEEYYGAENLEDFLKYECGMTDAEIIDYLNELFEM